MSRPQQKSASDQGKQDLQDVESQQAHVNSDIANTANVANDNIDNKHVTELVDELVNSAEVSISGGSDTEAAKSDSARLRHGDKGHSRTASGVKKPASFKAISVNRTFLTTKATPPNASPKPSEKPTPLPGASAPQVPTAAGTKPRLVARPVNGLVAKSGAGGLGAKGSSGPDGNTVWNKNRRKHATRIAAFLPCCF